MSSEAAHRSVVVLWLAMMVSVILYFGVAQLIPASEAAPEPWESTLSTAFLFGAFIAVALSFYVKSRLPSWRAGIISSLAACEAAALVGLVIRLVFAWPQYYVFLLLGLAGMLLNYPRRRS